MRNTQPLLATSPFGEGVEWKGPSLSRGLTRANSERREESLLERVQRVLSGSETSRRSASKYLLVGGRQATKRIEQAPASVFGLHSVLTDVPRWKRTIDLSLVVLTLPAWLGVMILITLWIKLVSPGPTFYKQERVGYQGRRFMILKFRSMKVNVETRSHEQHFENLIKANSPMAKLDAVGDPRLIAGGRLLRALGLDELPQLLNVLRGEMSLVGPRPCTPKEFEHYDAWHRERVKAPPGLTGFWQVNGKNRTTFTEMIAMDVYYADHMSACLDLEILLKTGTAVGMQALEANLRPRFGTPCK